MQGNGTQESPYIPENWEEFVQAAGTKNAYVAMPDGGGVFDMNEIAPDGGITVNFNCKFLDGNDWEIRNAYNVQFYNSSGSSGTAINRLHFLNFYGDKNNTNSVFIMLYAAFTECRFSGVIAGKQSVFQYGKFQRCSMNFQFIDEAYQVCYSKQSATFTFVRAVIDHSSSKGSANFYHISASNSFFEHKTNDSGLKITLVGNSNAVHSDAGNFITTSTGSSVNVTEEQLKNAAYLRSIGFPIAGD